MRAELLTVSRGKAVKKVKRSSPRAAGLQLTVADRKSKLPPRGGRVEGRGWPGRGRLGDIQIE